MKKDTVESFLEKVRKGGEGDNTYGLLIEAAEIFNEVIENHERKHGYNQEVADIISLFSVVWNIANLPSIDPGILSVYYRHRDIPLRLYIEKASVKKYTRIPWFFGLFSTFDKEERGKFFVIEEPKRTNLLFLADRVEDMKGRRLYPTLREQE